MNLTQMQLFELAQSQIHEAIINTQAMGLPIEIAIILAENAIAQIKSACDLTIARKIAEQNTQEQLAKAEAQSQESNNG